MTIKDPYLSSKCQEITSLINEAKQWAKQDAKLGAHLATYIDVLILGMLEVCVEYLVSERGRRYGDIDLTPMLVPPHLSSSV